MSPPQPSRLTLIRLLPLLAGWFCLARPASSQEPPTAAVIPAVTFAADPGKLYLPLMEVVQFMEWSVCSDPDTKELMLNGITLPKECRRRLVDGTELVSSSGLADGLAVVLPGPAAESVLVRGAKEFVLMRAAKRVEISLGTQQLRAWEGDRLVLETKVSTGRNGRTPAGNFTAGPYKARRHYSSRYKNAPMPWSVQINGHVFIHGFTSVPDYPASHGCIRMPLTGGNPARFFYEWVDVGTPVRILPAVKTKPARKADQPVAGR